ncbi:MAG: hypothetical protein JEZ09_10225 [Salinivirgaceae bacterium]|nr:hypothetical protein [Salinivirgaceae bacterium]
MKTKHFFLAIFAAVLLVFTSCEEETPTPVEVTSGILPAKFKVDIPNSLSNSNFTNVGLKSAENDTITGGAIYQNLNYFIAIGEEAADITEAIISHIALYKIQSVLELTYTSDDDNRVKKLLVESEVEFENRTWEYMLTISDLESEGNADGGKGMQVFWNNDPVEGIALLKPYNIDRVHDADAGDAAFSIEYSSKGNEKYDEYMIVEIVDFPKDPTNADIFAVDNIKMFVGKNGNIVDVYGNSNHPNAKFNTHSEVSGFNWAFVASGKQTEDIAVAEVGLPYSSLDSDSREMILVENSIKSVLSREMSDFIITEYAAIGITLQPEEVVAYLAPYLTNADAPGYFNTNGFIQGGTSPSGAYSVLESNVLELTPYNPKEISELAISFK